jgi:tetratricopeptide (TPR) repeat protein
MSKRKTSPLLMLRGEQSSQFLLPLPVHPLITVRVVSSIFEFLNIISKFFYFQIFKLFPLTILLISLFSHNIFATDFDFNSTIQNAYSEVLNMKLSSARSLILKEKKRSNLCTNYIESYADMVQLLVSEDKVFYEQFIVNQEDRLSVLENSAEKSPYQKFLQAEIRLHTAFVKLKFGRDVKGAWDIIKAYKLLDANGKEFPTFLPNQKSLGLLHILIGSTPESYTWVTKLLGLNGNIKVGLSEIQSAQKDPTFKIESQLIDYLVHAYILKFTDKKLSDFQNFSKENNEKVLFQFFAITTFMKEGKSDLAFEIIEDLEAKISRSKDYPTFPFLGYLKGEILLQKGLYPKALAEFLAFLKNYKGFNYLKDTHYKLFLCSWLMDDDVKAKTYLQKIPQTGERIVEADKAAQKFAENFLANQPKKAIPQKILMKARLSFDGGFYAIALAYLSNYQEVNFEKNYDKAEFNYRKARILHRMDDIPKAIVFYDRAIKLTENQEWSFGASSSLQLGYIFVAKGDKIKARAFFEKALAYKKHEYKNSIDNKAKAGLNEL